MNSQEQKNEIEDKNQVLIKKHSPEFWQVTFNNPPINLMGPEMIAELQQLMDIIEQDNQLKVIVFDSADQDYFISHFDVLRAAEVPLVSGELGVAQWIDVFNRLSNAGVISIASIRGRVRGVGSEFILACDMRFASRENAIFGHLEVATGVIPGGGAIEHLSKFAGYAKALEIIISSDDYSADLAESYGWINRAIKDTDLDGFVNSLATRISGFPAPALKAAKSAIKKRSGGSVDPIEIQESADKFFELIQTPEAQATFKKLMDLGFHQPGDTELRLGYYLGTLGK